jgi:hypothetical protein
MDWHNATVVCTNASYLHQSPLICHVTAIFMRHVTQPGSLKHYECYSYYRVLTFKETAYSSLNGFRIIRSTNSINGQIPVKTTRCFLLVDTQFLNSLL